jgi:hypothetical protein
MKKLLFMCVIMYATSSFSQKSDVSKLTNDIVKKDAYTFVPPIKLLNKDLWNRVSNTRFECSFLRLAVEYQDFEYVLYEMDEPKRELSRSPEYRIIGQEIGLNTVRRSPNFFGTNSNSTVSVAD